MSFSNHRELYFPPDCSWLTPLSGSWGLNGVRASHTPVKSLGLLGSAPAVEMSGPEMKLIAGALPRRRLARSRNLLYGD